MGLSATRATRFQPHHQPSPFNRYLRACHGQIFTKPPFSAKKKKKKGSITANVLRSLRTFSLLSFARLLFPFFFFSRSIPKSLATSSPPGVLLPISLAVLFSEGGGRLTRLPLGACLPFFFPPPAPFISLPFASTALGYRARIYRYPIGIWHPWPENPRRGVWGLARGGCVRCVSAMYGSWVREREREREVRTGGDDVGWCQLFSLMVCAPTGWGDRSVGSWLVGR